MNAPGVFRVPAPLLAAAVVLPVLLACGGDGGDGHAPPTDAVLGPAGGTVVHEGALLTVPAGALAAEVVVQVATVDLAAPLPDGLAQAGAVFRFTPHGQAFATPATVALPFDAGMGGLQVLVRAGPDGVAWDPVPGATFADGVATFAVGHFSDYVVAGLAGASAAVVAALDLPGWRPDALLPGDGHDLVVFDVDTDNDASRPHVRFIQVARDDASGTFAFTFVDDALPVAWTTGIPKGWMVRDPASGLLYVLAVDGRTTDAGMGWDRVWVHVLSGRAQAGAFTFNPDGGVPSNAPADFRFVPAGIALKPAGSESGNPARLFVHEIVGGNIEVLDLDAGGTALAARVRLSYRDRIEDACAWPPDPGPWDCHWLGTIGNTLALKWRLVGRVPAGLASDDLLYLTDHNVSASQVLPFRVTQAGDPVLTPLPAIDLAVADQVLVNGIEGLTAGLGDTVYVATGLQSFGDGLIGTIDAATQAPGVIRIPFGDLGDLAVDPADPRRVFVAVSDAFAEQPALQVHELVDGAVVRTVDVLEPHDGGRVAAMAYDPQYGLLYLVAGGRILAVRMDAGR
jgi:hypothetical protein